MKPEYDTRFNGLRDAFWIVHNLYIGSTISTPTEAKRKLRKILKQNECDDSFAEGINDDIATGFAVAVNIIKNSIEYKISQTEEHGTAEKPMTNADRIRAMSDRELAAFLAGKFTDHETEKSVQKGEILTATYVSEMAHTWFKAWMQWLRQPAEED